MPVGLQMYGADPRQFVAIAKRGEELGFDSLWIGEHVVAPEAMGAEHPYKEGWSNRAPVVSADERMYDVWTMIGALTAATQHVSIATGIYLLPLRHPIISARGCITAQQISGGRFLFGVGSGWLGTEFQALGVDFEHRAAIFDECLDVLEKLFRGGAIEHAGQFYSFPRLALVHEKVRVPVLMGGTKRPALRRAALRGDGWYGSTLPLPEAMEARDTVEAFRREFGREHLPFTYYTRVAGPPTVDTLAKYRAAGFEHLVIPSESVHPSTDPDRTVEARLRSLERVAADLGLKSRG